MLTLWGKLNIFPPKTTCVMSQWMYLFSTSWEVNYIVAKWAGPELTEVYFPLLSCIWKFILKMVYLPHCGLSNGTQYYNRPHTPLAVNMTKMVAMWIKPIPKNLGQPVTRLLMYSHVPLTLSAQLFFELMILVEVKNKTKKNKHVIYISQTTGQK